jgi:Tfp pilus assembly protein PilO
VKQRKPMPKGLVLALIVVGAIVVAFAGYTILVKPQKSKAAALTKETADKQATLDQYRAEAASAKTNAPPKIRVADIYRLARAMPATQDMPDILIELADVARAAGIQLESISPAPATTGNGYQVVPIALQFEADYYSVTDFLYRLRTLVSVRHGQLEATGRLFAIDSVSLSPTGTKLSASVKVETYIYGGAPAAPPTLPPPPTDTTTSTDTTSTTASAERGTP